MIYRTLGLAMSITFAITLANYALTFGGNPFDRIWHALLISVLPAICTFIVIKLTTVVRSWCGVIVIYLLLFLNVLMVQACVGGG